MRIERRRVRASAKTRLRLIEGGVCGDADSRLALLVLDLQLVRGEGLLGSGARGE